MSDDTNDRSKDGGPSTAPARAAQTRRQFLIRTAAPLAVALAAPAIIMPRPVRAASRPLTFQGWAGAHQANQNKAFFEPFAAKTGLEVVSTNPVSLAKIKAMVDAGNVEWDLVDIASGWILPLEQEGYLEELPQDIVDRNDMQESGALRKHCVKWYYNIGGIAYDPARTPKDKIPRTWAEFWDVEAFPGRRGLRKQPETNLEIALAADGVAADRIFPIDVDRAFASLDRIKDHIRIWPETTSQTTQMILLNELDYSMASASLVAAAQKQGGSIEYIYDMPVLQGGFLGIPKGSPNKDAAIELIRYIMSPEAQLAFSTYATATMPMSKTAFANLSPEARAKVPDIDNPNMIKRDDEWWGANGPEMSKRYNEWMLR